MRTDTLPPLALEPLPVSGRTVPLRERAGRSGVTPRSAGWGVALLLVLLAVGVVSAWGMHTFPARVDDEGTYAAQAWAVQQWNTLSHYTYWYDHPPLGWIQIAGWNWLTGALDRAPHAVGAARELMLVAKVASAGVLYVLARRLGLRRGWSLAAVGLFALSPLAVAFQRMAYLDNIATFWALAAFALALSPRGRLVAHAASAGCFAVCVLTKETALILLPALVWQLWRGSDPSTRKFSLAVFFAVLVFSGSFYLLYAALKGELLPGDDHVSLLSAVLWQLSGRESSGSVLDPTSAAWGVVQSWLDLDVWLVGGALVLIPLGFAVARLRPVALALAIQVLMLLRDGYLPFPYVIGLLPFAALLIAGVADAAWGHDGLRVPARRWALRAPVVAAVAVAALAVAPAWAAGIERQMTEDRDLPMRSAHAWVTEHVPSDATVVVDDTIWVDLVRQGFDRSNVIWFYKLDLDPAVHLENGWRSVDYVVLGAMPPDIESLPLLQETLRHSEAVATFHAGSDTATVYEVQK